MLQVARAIPLSVVLTVERLYRRRPRGRLLALVDFFDAESRLLLSLLLLERVDHVNVLGIAAGRTLGSLAFLNYLLLGQQAPRDRHGGRFGFAVEASGPNEFLGSHLCCCGGDLPFQVLIGERGLLLGAVA